MASADQSHKFPVGALAGPSGSAGSPRSTTEEAQVLVRAEIEADKHPELAALPTAQRQLGCLAMRYLDSYPGQDLAAKNIWVLARCLKLLQGRSLSNEDAEELDLALQYRVFGIMETATQCKNHLRIDFPDCEKFNRPAFAPVNVDRVTYDQRNGWVRDLVYSKTSFERAGEGVRFPYVKGVQYLGAMFADGQWDEQQVSGLLDEFLRLRGRHPREAETDQ